MFAVWTTSCGARFGPLSRLASTSDLAELPRSSIVTSPLPETSDVTFTDTQVPVANPPPEPALADEATGALFHVIPLSSHELLRTPLTLKPRLLPARA
jgi:hypothetical protein